MSGISTDELVAGMMPDAIETFAQHVIRRRESGLWEIGRADGCSNFETLILCPGMARLVLTGDGPDMILRSSYASPREAISWMAGSGLRYLQSKALCGNVEAWNREVARHDLDLFAAEEADDTGKPEEAWVQEARDLLDHEAEKSEFVAHVFDALESSDTGGDWGDVPHWDLIAAREAVRCLLRLLRAEEKSGPS